MRSTYDQSKSATTRTLSFWSTARVSQHNEFLADNHSTNTYQLYPSATIIFIRAKGSRMGRAITPNARSRVPTSCLGCSVDVFSSIIKPWAFTSASCKCSNANLPAKASPTAYFFHFIYADAGIACCAECRSWPQFICKSTWFRFKFFTCAWDIGTIRKSATYCGSD